MQIDFKPTSIKRAKEVLSKELQMAEHIHHNEKEHQKELAKKPTLWMRIKRFLDKIF